MSKDKQYLIFIPVLCFAISTTIYTNYKMDKMFNTMRENMEKNMKKKMEKYEKKDNDNLIIL
jgi:hypothetical protein